MEHTTYYDVGIEAGLKGRNLMRYVEYMTTRWADTEQSKCYDGYAKEWATRFMNGIEYEASDIHGQKVLITIDERWIQKVKDYYEEGLDAALKEMHP